jgi:hypothetical protein
MNHIASIKRRAIARRHQAGAAMFVVSMMITVLGAVGMFALAAAATEVKTAGNERQSAQTHYLAELGVMVAQREAPGLLINTFASTSPEPCDSLPLPSYVGSDKAKACHKFEYPKDFVPAAGWAVQPVTSYTLPPYTVSAPPGSLGPVPVTPQFKFEVTDMSAWMISGYSGSGSTSGYNGTSANGCLITVSSFGRTLPSFQGASAYGGLGNEIGRARIVATGVPQQICP